MILLREVDKPKTAGQWLSQFFARPPQPVLRFYKDFTTETTDGRRHILFAVRSGVPLPLLYGIYVEARYDSFTGYIEKTDHILPFSTDDWRLTLDTTEPAQIELRVGLVPVEILTDRVKITV
ncbi:hypothetical protein ES705_34470 [subsurface metagenome]